MRFIIIFMTLMLASCAATGTYYKGARVGHEDALPLPATSVSGQTWQDRYLKIDYALSRQGDRLLIEGNLSFSLYPQLMLVWADDVTLNLYLLDDDGIVQSYLELTRVLGSGLDESIPFRKELPLTKKVTAIWFGYEGEFFGERHDGSEHVWKRPKRS
jgi:hypothetical protein